MDPWVRQVNLPAAGAVKRAFTPDLLQASSAADLPSRREVLTGSVSLDTTGVADLGPFPRRPRLADPVIASAPGGPAARKEAVL